MFSPAVVIPSSHAINSHSSQVAFKTMLLIMQNYAMVMMSLEPWCQHNIVIKSTLTNIEWNKLVRICKSPGLTVYLLVIILAMQTRLHNHCINMRTDLNMMDMVAGGGLSTDQKITIVVPIIVAMVQALANILAALINRRR